MKEIDYLAEYARMCESYDVCCLGCPFNDPNDECSNIIFNDVFAAKAKIAAWSAAHPQKTYAQDFFEKFPNASVNADGTPHACASNLYGHAFSCSTCADCWNRPMP